MSKASHWLSLFSRTPRPSLNVGHVLDPVATVTDEGKLRVMADLRPADALKLARWILDTFDEEERERRMP